MPLPTPHHTPRHYNSNVHRGVHYLSAKATTAYEDARAKVARFINAASDREVVFTRNASEAINLVAQTWGLDNLKAGDEVRGRTGGGGGESVVGRGECGWEGSAEAEGSKPHFSSSCLCPINFVAVGVRDCAAVPKSPDVTCSALLCRPPPALRR